LVELSFGRVVFWSSCLLVELSSCRVGFSRPVVLELLFGRFVAHSHRYICVKWYWAIPGQEIFLFSYLSLSLSLSLPFSRSLYFSPSLSLSISQKTKYFFIHYQFFFKTCNIQANENNYLFDKKKKKLFSTGFLAREQKIRWKTVFIFLLYTVL
jgi:hypothetical protein